MPITKQSRISGALALVIAQAVVLVLGWVIHPFIGRVLGPASYGIYGLVLSMQSIIGLLLTLGVPIAVSRFVARDEDHARSILFQALAIQTLIATLVSVITLLASSWIARVLGDPLLTNYIRFTSLVIFLQAYYPLFVQFLSGLHHFNRQALLTGAYALAKLLGAVSLIFWFEVYGALAGFAIGGVLAGLLGLFWTRHIGGRLKRQLAIKNFLQFAGMYVLILVGLQILISLDLFMVKALLKDNAQAGYYNAAVTLSRIPYLLLQALAFILLPSVSVLTKPGKSQQQAANFIGVAIRYLIALIVPSVALASATSRPLLSLFYSNQYSTAAPVLTILMIGVGSLAFYLLLINIVAGAGRARIALVLTVALIISSAIIGFILIPRLGLIGAAWQTTSVGVIGLAILGIYTFRTFKIPWPIRSTVNILIASAIAILPTYFWQATAVTLIIQYLCSGLLYVFALLALQEVTNDDRLRLSSLHRSLAWLAPTKK